MDLDSIFILLKNTSNYAFNVYRTNILQSSSWLTEKIPNAVVKIKVVQVWDYSTSHSNCPPQNKNKNSRRRKGGCKLQEKHHYETHKQWMPVDTACRDRSTLELKFCQSTHKQGNNENPGGTTETIWSLQSFHQYRWG